MRLNMTTPGNHRRPSGNGAVPLRTIVPVGLVCALAVLLSGCVSATNPPRSTSDISGSDTAFLALSAALVMLMTPALALFYGGLVRAQNVLSVMMHCFTALALVSLQWWLWGYSLAFSPSWLHIGKFGILGSLNWIGGREVGLTPYPAYSTTVPHQLFMVYQCMFAAITPALIAGAFAERMKFRAFVLFVLLWSTCVYDPVAHWVWSENGWLKHLGSLDFAGGTVVHITSGMTALVAALIIGPRLGFPRTPFVPHSVVLTMLGAGLLWFGWFGFNAGSALGATTVAVVAFVATHCGAAGGALGWLLYDRFMKRQPTALGFASGAVAGLVAITPAAGFVGSLSSFLIGAVAGMVCAIAVSVRVRCKIDDALDAFGVHGVGGTLGALLTGVFATSQVNPAIGGNEGIVHGHLKLFLIQCVAILVTIVYTIGVSYLILKIVDVTVGLRVSEEEEKSGLDLSQHGENAYAP